jgi:hypothetical protein
VRLAALPATIAVAVACACGGSSDDPDAAPPIDARHLTDAAVVACSADAGCSGELMTPVCDLDRGACVECVSDEDCTRSGAFGPSCDPRPGYCRCSSDDDCAGNDNGPYCHAVTHACTCLLDGDCADGQQCHLEPYLGRDVRTCHETSER